MANTLLTPTAVTRRALAILHQNLNFIGKVNRQYDDSFAVSGAKIGNTLKIRLPNKYTVTTGATLVTQDTTETSEDLVVATQKHVGMTFTTAELALDIDDFSQRIIEPAMAVLAADIEADAMSMAEDVWNTVIDNSNPIDRTDVLNMNKKITDDLSPYTNRCLNMNTADNVNLVDSLAGLFNPQGNISRQYRQGLIQNQFLGFSEVYENTLWPQMTAGTQDGAYLVNGAAQTGNSLIVDTGAGTMTKGQVFTIAGVNRVHPETKVDTGELQQFVVTALFAGGAGTVSIDPAITTSTGSQTVTASPADNAAITFLQTSSTSLNTSLGFHRDAFTFATADLEVPNGTDFAAREVYDGISLRVIRDYTINDDSIPARVDVLYGFKSVRPEQACKGHFTAT
ncbi:MAG: P22 phage major capsid protein family protein [Geminicoccaceae bacterium]